MESLILNPFVLYFISLGFFTCYELVELVGEYCIFTPPYGDLGFHIGYSYFIRGFELSIYIRWAPPIVMIIGELEKELYCLIYVYCLIRLCEFKGFIIMCSYPFIPLCYLYVLEITLQICCNKIFKKGIKTMCNYLLLPFYFLFLSWTIYVVVFHRNQSWWTSAWNKITFCCIRNFIGGHL